MASCPPPTAAAQPDPDWVADTLPTGHPGPVADTGEDPYDGIAGVLVPDRMTPHTPAEIRAILAAGHLRTFGTPVSANALTLASAMIFLESGWGKAIHDENYGNIGRGRFGGDYFPLTAREVIGGHDKQVTQLERAHDSAEAGAADYWDFLARSYPAALAAMERGDVAGAAHALKVGHYYSETEEKYAALWVALVAENDRRWPR